MIAVLMLWLWSAWFAIAIAAPIEGRQPQIASRGHDVFLTFGRENSVLVAKSVDGGVTFAAPVLVATPGKLSLGMRRGPRIAASAEAVMVAAIAGERGGGADGDVLFWRSTDGGRRWAAAPPLNDVPGSAREGMHALGANAAGVVVVAWLDLRGKGTRIVATVSRDHGATWGPNGVVYQSPSGTVCECCHPSVAVSGDGAIAIMFRNSLDGARDLYVTVSRDARTFTPPAKQGSGRWALDACPMDGGDVEWAAGEVTSIWRREGQIFSVRANGPERLVADGADPVSSGVGGLLDLAWSGPDGLTLQRSGRERERLGTGRFPSLLARPDRTVIAWEHGNQIHVRVLPR